MNILSQIASQTELKPKIREWVLGIKGGNKILISRSTAGCRLCLYGKDRRCPCDCGNLCKGASSNNSSLSDTPGLCSEGPPFRIYHIALRPYLRC